MCDYKVFKALFLYSFEMKCDRTFSVGKVLTKLLINLTLFWLAY
jgi:hypothetical protein